VVVVGNEVLTAKVMDANGALAIRRLRDLRIPLRSLEIVPDEIDAIVGAVVRGRRRAAGVITSGGIGPTHDDVTVRAVALALGRSVVRLPELVAQVAKHYGPNAPAEALRLADAPEGARLLRQEGAWYPVLACDGVFMLPGVPQLFALQLEAVLEEWEPEPAVLRNLFLSAGEPEIAHALDRIAREHPDVAIGSYPTFDRAAGYRVKLTVEHARSEAVQRVVERLTAELPPGCVLRVEEGR